MWFLFFYIKILVKIERIYKYIKYFRLERFIVIIWEGFIILSNRIWNFWMEFDLY